MKQFNVVFSGELASLTTQLESRGVTITKIFPSIRVLTILAENTDILQGISQIVAAEENVQTILENSGYWHQLRVNSKTLPMRPVYTPQNMGENIVVYVVDSGIDKTHPELTTANITDLYSFDGSYGDTQGHGTSVASLIVGQTVGVSKNAVVKNVKIQSGIQILVSDLLEAFDAILADHLLTPSVKIVNCSWTVAKNQILDMKISELETAGLIVVAAAGNKIEAADNYSPVGLDTVIGCAASDAYDRVISWAPGAGSNWGPEVDITAPGIEVDVAGLNGSIVTGSGTSYAAAIISGLLCQHIHKNPSANASQVKNLFLAAGLTDVLFRNETIYGTTPNLLAQSVYHTNIFTAPTSSYFTVKKGESITIPFEFVLPAVSVSIDNIFVGTHVRIPPSWATLQGNMLHIAPPTNTQTSSYRIFFEAKDDANQSISINAISIGVFTENENEISRSAPEMYYSMDNDVVIVRLDACNNVGCDMFGNDDGSCGSQIQKNGGCGCAGSSCAIF